jgi:hypothetical protein
MIELSTIRDLVAIFGVIAGFSYYVLTVQNQRKARQAQLFTQIYQSRYNEEGSKRFWKTVLLEWEDYDDYMKKYGPYENPEVTYELVALTTEWNYFDGLGILLKDKMVDEETVYRMLGMRILIVWLRTEVLVDEIRNQEGTGAGEDYMEGFEFLAERMIELRKKKGISLPIGWIHPTTSRYQHLLQ